MAEQPEGKKARLPKKVPAPIRRAWDPTPYDPSIATALQAMMRGECPGHLQTKAITHIVYNICGTYEPQFRPGPADAARETDFALGKAFVGQQIVGLLKVKTNAEGEQG